ncbi:hypothetical protein [Moritella sp. F3]|uniref:hypothetical protein n=1 Tax=Moritella sp. F3 TaxID=2718882 RepID=UPI0018E0CCE4|nr:hypothetical protein [Moritella sp. F3]GIC77615.1 hypothetical protein FMO001_23420 [Moritella sp. F1]GIC82028.1 hypothetical protein FMO003_23090 [Moritella sp. F3]
MKGQYIQFFRQIENCTILTEEKGPGCVLFLDGRLSLGSCVEHAVKHCREHGIKGFSIKVKNGQEWNNQLTSLWTVYPNSIIC